MRNPNVKTKLFKYEYLTFGYILFCVKMINLIARLRRIELLLFLTIVKIFLIDCIYDVAIVSLP